MRSNWRGEGPNYNVISVFIRRKETQKHRQRKKMKTDTCGEGHVRTEAEIRVMHLQVKESQGLEASHGTVLLKSLRKDMALLPSLIQLLTSKTVKI